MARKKKSRTIIGNCVYCWRHGKLTKDHVIPLCLFTHPYPSNLITVPVCDSCNNAKSRDDDFIRDFLTCDVFGNQDPVANRVFQEKVLKSVRRNSSELGRSAVSHYRNEPLYTNGGIYLGDVVAAPVDASRIERIMTRIVRGLYHDARRERISDDYSFKVLQYRPWDFKQLVNKYEENKLSFNRRSLGDVFECGFLFAKEDPFTTFWLIVFYKQVFFTVDTTLAKS